MTEWRLAPEQRQVMAPKKKKNTNWISLALFSFLSFRFFFLFFPFRLAVFHHRRHYALHRFIQFRLRLLFSSSGKRGAIQNAIHIELNGFCVLNRHRHTHARKHVKTHCSREPHRDWLSVLSKYIARASACVCVVPWTFVHLKWTRKLKSFNLVTIGVTMTKQLFFFSFFFYHF